MASAAKIEARANSEDDQRDRLQFSGSFVEIAVPGQGVTKAPRYFASFILPCPVISEMRRVVKVSLPPRTISDPIVWIPTSEKRAPRDMVPGRSGRPHCCTLALAEELPVEFDAGGRGVRERGRA